MPEARLILGSLLEKFHAFAPPALTSDVSREALRALIDLDAGVTGLHGVSTHRTPVGKTSLVGFTGRVDLRLHSDSLSFARAFGRWLALLPYGGCGAKTTFGMGQARVFRAGVRE